MPGCDGTAAFQHFRAATDCFAPAVGVRIEGTRVALAQLAALAGREHRLDSAPTQVSEHDPGNCRPCQQRDAWGGCLGTLGDSGGGRSPRCVRRQPARAATRGWASRQMSGRLHWSSSGAWGRCPLAEDQTRSARAPQDPLSPVPVVDRLARAEVLSIHQRPRSISSSECSMSRGQSVILSNRPSRRHPLKRS
jgi:hypothetical protein